MAGGCDSSWEGLGFEEVSEETLMSDSPREDDWFTAIGAIQNDPANFPANFPNFPGQFGENVYKVELYVYEDNKEGDKCPCTSGYRKVFSHNSMSFEHEFSDQHRFFANNAEALWKNHDDETRPLFSRLRDIEQFKDANGKFRFKLVYPEVPGFIEWTQTSNPIAEKTIAGFKLIGELEDSILKNRESIWKWKGLGLGEEGKSLMEESTKNGMWQTAIGAQKSWPQNSPKFPGTEIVEVEGMYKVVSVHAVELYAFYDNKEDESSASASASSSKLRRDENDNKEDESGKKEDEIDENSEINGNNDDSPQIFSIPREYIDQAIDTREEMLENIATVDFLLKTSAAQLPKISELLKGKYLVHV